MTSVPTLGCHSWTGSAGEGSSVTDSQFLFGSQLWPDQSQKLSQDIAFSSRISQHGSPEASESSISSSYHSKPYLFGGDFQDKSKVVTLTGRKNKGILERFEEDKRKSKDKEESDVLMGHMLQLGDCMENMKITLNCIERNIDSAKNSILQCLETFTKTIQDNVANMRDNMATQLEALLHKLDCEGEIMRETKDRNAKMDLEVSALQSCVQGLNQDLQDLRAEQSKELGMMGDALSLLQGLISSQKPTAGMVDQKVQTSPCLLERFCLAGEEAKHLQGLQLCSGPVQFVGGEGKGGDFEWHSDAEPSVQRCSVNLSTAGVGEDFRRRSCSIRSPSRRRSGYINSPARILNESSAPNGTKLLKCPQGLSGQRQGTGQQSVYTAGKNLKKPSRYRPALKKRARVESAQKSQLGWSGDSCRDGHDGSVVQERFLQDLTGCVKAMPSFNTSSVWQQSLWQLFNIADDSD
ncbi:interactor of HORMAD1 protein 1 isoform X2 [Scleropages formosus]|uniref:interactor of HORMAD1 protein 1 isoform X2 n=1 Tax=Scleropages formosus TaxID=113540 RepID=UPI0010FAA1EE|nr:interactor of HORMAD1 protein 1 isoform X2 [Scleropages formosus]XP_029107471.1 interactor of HORMAD1 protein 1 isoform X2 [Scleropages formosus]